jgi:hypothetical protein
MMWDWTKDKLAKIARTNVGCIPDELPLCRTLNIGPPKRRRAALWILANFVAFRLQQRQRLTGNDYHDFLRRARWKLQHRKRWKERVGDYLDVLGEEHIGRS